MRLWVTWILLPSTTDSDLEAEGCLQSSVLMLMCLSVYDDTLLLHYYHDYMLTVMYKLILKIRQEISLCMMLVKYVTASPSTTGRGRGGGDGDSNPAWSQWQDGTVIILHYTWEHSYIVPSLSKLSQVLNQKTSAATFFWDNGMDRSIHN